MARDGRVWNTEDEAARPRRASSIDSTPGIEDQSPRRRDHRFGNTLGVLFALLAISDVSRPPIAACGGGEVTLEWTAPGDDGLFGDASLYDIRYSKRPITERNFDLATRALVKRALAAGTTERCRIGDLDRGEDYYFAVRTQDDAGNWSPISNIAVFLGRGIGTEPESPLTSMPTIPLEFSPPVPNPARGAVRFDLSLPTAGPAHVDVYDITGRLVRVLVASLQPAGVNRVGWDLLDEFGNRVEAGVYLIRAETEGLTRLRRLVVLR
jgi:hypothetical protein